MTARPPRAAPVTGSCPVVVRPVRTLAIVAAGLVSAHLLALVAGALLGPEHLVPRLLVRLFWLSGEQNLPAWFSSGLLWTAAVVLFAIAALQRASGRGGAVGWVMLGLVFTVLSIDEACSFHEATNAWTRGFFSRGDTLYAHPWVVGGAIASVAIAVAFLPFLRRLPASTRRTILLAGALYVTGALLCETLGSWLKAQPGSLARQLYRAEIVAEEGLEMAGALVFLYALLGHLVGLLGADLPTGIAAGPDCLRGPRRAPPALRVGTAPLRRPSRRRDREG